MWCAMTFHDIYINDIILKNGSKWKPKALDPVICTENMILHLHAHLLIIFSDTR